MQLILIYKLLCYPKIIIQELNHLLKSSAFAIEESEKFEQ